MFQIMLLGALILMLDHTKPSTAALTYGLGNTMIHFMAHTPVLSLKIWPVLLLKTVFMYVFFRILSELDREPGWWWLVFFIAMPLLFVCDRWLGLPLLPGYSGIPFVDTPF